MTNEKKTPSLKWVMYGEILVLISLLLLLFGLENFNLPSITPHPSQSQTETIPDDLSEPTMPSISTEPFVTDLSNPVRIKTPYGTLDFPEGYGEYLSAQLIDNPYGIQYVADFGDGKTQNLFAILFGGDGENSVGTANNTPVYVVVSAVSGEWSEVQIRTIYAMQEELTALLRCILDGTPQNPDEFLPTDDGTSLVVETPYGNLRFPNRWKDSLVLTVDDGEVYSVTFACKTENHGNHPLFTVYFGGNKGMEAGIICDEKGKATVALVDFFDFSPDNSWSYQEKSLVTSMQEDINYLIQNLK